MSRSPPLCQFYFSIAQLTKKKRRMCICHKKETKCRRILEAGEKCAGLTRLDGMVERPAVRDGSGRSSGRGGRNQADRRLQRADITIIFGVRPLSSVPGAASSLPMPSSGSILIEILGRQACGRCRRRSILILSHLLCSRRCEG